MNTEQTNNSQQNKRVFDITIQMLLILLLITWSALIIIPFVPILLWSVILAITIFPLYTKVLKWVKGKKILASSLITIIFLGVLLVPTILLISSIVKEVVSIKTSLTDNSLIVPPPNSKVTEWPLVGQKIYDAWSSLSTNLESAMITYREQILTISKVFASSLKGLASNIMVFTFSLVIMGVFLTLSEKTGKSVSLFANRLIGNKSDDYLDLIVKTVRNVAKGIIGVAFIQFLIMGLCFMLAGVPYPGLLALVVLVFALVQLPGALVAIPVIIYIYSVKEPLPATIWAVIILICGLSDNVLKPWLMGKGAPVPMIVIFLGAIGGFVLSGFIGLFTGAIVLSLMYKVTGYWIAENSSESTSL